MYIHDTQGAQISNLGAQDGHNTYAIMKTMYPPGYYQNGFVETKALGHIMYVVLLSSYCICICMIYIHIFDMRLYELFDQLLNLQNYIE